MRQHKWLQLVKDYDCKILYHLGKEHVVPGVKQEKLWSLAPLDMLEKPLQQELISVELEVVVGKKVDLSINSNLLEEIWIGKKHNDTLVGHMDAV